MGRLEDFIENGVSAYKYGYFPQPVSPDRLKYPPFDMARWKKVHETLPALQQGDFSTLDFIWTQVLETDDPLLTAACCQILGDAGTVRLFKAMREDLTQCLQNNHNAVSLDKGLDYGYSFYRWGRLDVIPYLLDLYLTLLLRGFGDRDGIDVIPTWIGDLVQDTVMDSVIGHGTTVDMVDEYFTVVLEAYEQKSLSLGSSQGVVWKGELVSVRRLAERMRHPPPRFLPVHMVEVRNRFEAATGIDCSAIFMRHGKYVPLEAAIIAENFLNSSAAQHYVPGTRYFFGHPIPDWT